MRTSLLVLLFLSMTLFVSRNTTSAQEPTKAAEAPAGWKYVDGKDGSYQFLIPEKTQRTSTRERSFSSGRMSVRIQLFTCTDTNGINYTVESLRITSPTPLKMSEAKKIITDSQKDEGYKVSEPTDYQTEKYKGFEFFASKGTDARHVVCLNGRPGLYSFVVEGKKTDDVNSKDAKIFLNSLSIKPKTAVAAKEKDKPADPKSDDSKPAAEGLPTWTLDLKKMTIPDAPASGKISGGEFHVESAELINTGLTLRQGKDFHPDLALSVIPFKQPAELAGTTIEVSANTRGNKPHIYLKRKMPGETLPKTESAATGYSMKLEFGEIKAGKITGKIYISLNDKNKSVVAGTFEAKVR